MKQPVEAIETGSSKGQAERVSLFVSSFLFTPAQVAPTYAKIGLCMIAETDE